MDRYFYAGGLRALAADLPDQAVIHTGSRPYGLHAGNKLPIVVYPYLLAAELQRLGRAPSFRYVITPNDWDTDTLDHEPGYPYHFVPRGRSFQYQADPAGCCATVVDHWERLLWSELQPLRERFPEVVVDVRRVSTFRAVSAFADALRFGLADPAALAHRIERTFGVPVVPTRAQFIGAVCPTCHSIDGATAYDRPSDRVAFTCRNCDRQTGDEFGRFDYWLYTHLLGAAKYRAADPDVWIFGGDFADTRTIDFVESVIELLQGRPPRMKKLFTPVLLGSDGEKMSKSRRNLLEVPVDWLLDQAATWDEPRLAPPGGLEDENYAGRAKHGTGQHAEWSRSQ